MASARPPNGGNHRHLSSGFRPYPSVGMYERTNMA